MEIQTCRGVSNLGAEQVVLVGELEKVDETHKTWRIATSEGKFSGTTQEGGPSLKGLKIGSNYRFSCMDEVEEVEGTGREQRTLYLTEHEPA